MGKFVPRASLADSSDDILNPDENGSFASQVALSNTKNSTSGPQRESVYPASLIFSSAFCATCLGSLANLPEPKPDWTSQIILAVLIEGSIHGTMPKVEESGTRSMSDS